MCRTECGPMDDVLRGVGLGIGSGNRSVPVANPLRRQRVSSAPPSRGLPAPSQGAAADKVGSRRAVKAPPLVQRQLISRKARAGASQGNLLQRHSACPLSRDRSSGHGPSRQFAGRNGSSDHVFPWRRLKGACARPAFDQSNNAQAECGPVTSEDSISSRPSTGRVSIRPLSASRLHTTPGISKDFPSMLHEPRVRPSSASCCVEDVIKRRTVEVLPRPDDALLACSDTFACTKSGALAELTAALEQCSAARISEGDVPAWPHEDWGP